MFVDAGEGVIADLRTRARRHICCTAQGSACFGRFRQFLPAMPAGKRGESVRSMAAATTIRKQMRAIDPASGKTSEYSATTTPMPRLSTCPLTWRSADGSTPGKAVLRQNGLSSKMRLPTVLRELSSRRWNERSSAIRWTAARKQVRWHVPISGRRCTSRSNRLARQEHSCSREVIRSTAPASSTRPQCCRRPCPAFPPLSRRRFARSGASLRTADVERRETAEIKSRGGIRQRNRQVRSGAPVRKESTPSTAGSREAEVFGSS